MEHNGFVLSCFLFVLLLVVSECTNFNTDDNQERIHEWLEELSVKTHDDTTEEDGINFEVFLSTLIHEAVSVNTKNDVCDRQLKQVFNISKTWALQSK